MTQSPAIELLKQALRRLPGVGPKSAQRMALHLLQRDREGAKQIVQALENPNDKFEFPQTGGGAKEALNELREFVVLVQVPPSHDDPVFIN